MYNLNPEYFVHTEHNLLIRLTCCENIHHQKGDCVFPQKAIQTNISHPIRHKTPQDLGIKKAACTPKCTCRFIMQKS